MNKEIIRKMIRICDEKIQNRGEGVGLSFYAFFSNKNDNSKLLSKLSIGGLYSTN